MSRSFTKLFSSITESTVWSESLPTRIVWITMLAMADRTGRVWASIPGLANRARVTIEETEAALARFLAPDGYSRTPDNEGRRIEPIEGGWRLLNYQKYREIRDVEARRDYKREWDRSNRRRSGNPSIPPESDTVRQHPTQAEAEAELPSETTSPQGALAPIESADQLIWRTGLALLVQSGVSQKSARSILGKHAARDKVRLAKIIGEMAVARPAIVEPVAYLERAMQPELKQVAL